MWNTDTDRLCTNCRSITTTVESLCPASIPRGRITSSCDRRLNSSCFFTCDTGCSRQATKLYCELGFYWDSASYACYCPRSNTPSYSSPTGGAGSAMIGGVAAAVLFVIILVVGCVVVLRKRQRQSSTPRCIVSQGSDYMYQTSTTERQTVGTTHVSATPSIDGIASLNDGITSPNYSSGSASDANSSHNIISISSSLEPRQNSENIIYPRLQPTLGYNSYTDRPPSYTSLALVEPQVDPPSYEQATSNPVEFNVWDWPKITASHR